MLLSSLRSPSKLWSGTTVNLVIFLLICFLLKILLYIHSEHQSLLITISMNTSDVSRRILFRICSKSVPIFLLFFLLRSPVHKCLRTTVINVEDKNSFPNTRICVQVFGKGGAKRSSPTQGSYLK